MILLSDIFSEKTDGSYVNFSHAVRHSKRETVLILLVGCNQANQDFLDFVKTYKIILQHATWVQLH